MKARRGVTVATAGHIDHGKTALVKALTGVDTDRLIEERRRGISIELGYASLDLEGETPVSVIDVPGHERFVRTMIAGATGVDAFLIVIDAKEGAMAQTREHLGVLRALAIEGGVCAITRVDLATTSQRAEARKGASAFLGDVPVIETSALTGEGIEGLKAALLSLARETATRDSGEGLESRPAVLHIDRVFTMKGHGTVVTGTLWAGRFHQGQEARVLPSGKPVRIRGIECHGEPVGEVGPRRRAALNLAGVRAREVARGDVLSVEPTEVRCTYRIDAKLDPGDLPADLDLERLQVHHGTREAPAKLFDLKVDGYIQLRLERPLLVRGGDHLVLRMIANPTTLGGAIVVDPEPQRHGPNNAPITDLKRLGYGSASDLIKMAVGVNDSPGLTAFPHCWASDRVLGAVLHRFTVRELGRAAEELAERGMIKRSADRYRPPRNERRPRTGDGSPVPTRLESDHMALIGILHNDRGAPQPLDILAEQTGKAPAKIEKLIEDLIGAGQAVRVAPGIVWETSRLNEATQRLIDHAEKNGSISLAEARDLLDIGRRHSQALIEYLNRTARLLRRADRHYPRPSDR